MALDATLARVIEAVKACRRAAISGDPETVERSAEGLAFAAASLSSAVEDTRAAGGEPDVQRNHVIAVREAVRATRPLLDMTLRVE